MRTTRSSAASAAKETATPCQDMSNKKRTRSSASEEPGREVYGAAASAGKRRGKKQLEPEEERHLVAPPETKKKTPAHQSQASGKRRRTETLDEAPVQSDVIVCEQEAADVVANKDEKADIEHHERNLPASPVRTRPEILRSPVPLLQPEPFSPLPMRSPRRTAYGSVFDPSKPSHVSLILAALSQEVTVKPAEDSTAAPQIPGAPYGRQQQFTQLYNVIHSGCQEGVGKCVYISGLPGTGKSHTVRAVVSALQANSPETAPVAVFVSCFGLRDPGEVYAAVHNQCVHATGHMDAPIDGSASSDAAHETLLKHLQGVARAANKVPGGKSSRTAHKGSRRVVIVLDEVDRLLSARSGIDHLTKLFMMPHATGGGCSVVAMANSLDVTERCLPELKLRGCAPTFMPFGAYLRVQLLSIMTAKLAALPWPVFEQSALELAARKVAASTGDFRKVLQACRLAVRILAEQHGNTSVSGHDASDAIPTSPRSRGVGSMAALSPSRLVSSAALASAAAMAGAEDGLQAVPTSLGAKLDSVAEEQDAECTLQIKMGPLQPSSPNRVNATARSPLQSLSPNRQQQQHTSAVLSPSKRAALLKSPRPVGTADCSSQQPTSPRSRQESVLSPRRLQSPAALPVRLVTAKEMVAALSRVMYQAGSAASNVATIKNLPQQQQVCLLALASALATAAEAAAGQAAAQAAAQEHGLTASAYRAKYYWGPGVQSAKKSAVKLANPFAAQAGTSTPAKPPVAPGKSTAAASNKNNNDSPTQSSKAGLATPSSTLKASVVPGTPSTPATASGVLAGDAARAVPMSAAYDQYRALCAAMFQQPMSEQEFSSQQQLLSHMGLVSLASGAGAGLHSSARKAGRQSSNGGALLLKAAMKDIHMALKDSVVFKKVLASLPSA